MLAQIVDGVLFSLLEGVSCMSPIQTVCQRLSLVGARILGAVISASRDQDSYGYRYSYPPLIDEVPS
jgi:hypothetical protein